jgi:hypothetical protein
MATIAGYNVLFVIDNRVKQITMSHPDDRVIEEWLADRFGPVHILSRTPLDAKSLGLLELETGQWMEWAPLARSP